MNVKSQATITYAYTLGGVDVKSVAVSNVVNTQIRTTELLVKKLVSSEYYKPEDYLTYTIVITNDGNYEARNISIVEQLDDQQLIPETFSYHFMRESDNSVVNYNYNDNVLTLQLSTLAPHAIAILSYRVKVSATLDLSKEISTQTTVKSDEVNEFSPNTYRLKQGYAKVECLKTAINDYAYLNTDLTYKLVLNNVGNIKANNVVVTDQLPETFELYEVVNGDTAINFEYENNNLQFVISEILPDEELVVYVKGKIVK